MFHALPYIRGVSETASRIFRKHNIHIAHQPTSTIRTMLSKPKDQRSELERRNSIYKIPCSECDKVYIGQTGKQLKTRIHEHKLAVKRIDPKSQIATHILETGHPFDFERAKSIAYCQHTYGRLFKEAWYSDHSSLNRHIEIDSIYSHLRRQQQQCNNI